MYSRVGILAYGMFQGGIYATPLQLSAEDDDPDLLAALRNTLDWCTNEVHTLSHMYAITFGARATPTRW